MSATFAVKKKCCCDADTTPQYYQGFDCKDGGAALPIYTRTTNSPGSLYYKLGAYCVQFGNTPNNEGDLPDDAIIIPGSSLTESFETCEECTPGGCPTENCGIVIRVTITFPADCIEGMLDIDVELTPQGDGTWKYEADDPDSNLVTIKIQCSDGVWSLTYEKFSICPGGLIWTRPQVDDCPVFTDLGPGESYGPWDDSDDSLVACCTTRPTAVVYVPEP